MLTSAELDIGNVVARDGRDDGVIDKWFLDVLRIESEALEQFMRSAPPGIAAIVQLIAAEKRPIVCMGIGKSGLVARSEEHTSELQSLMRISYAVFCLKKKNVRPTIT